MESHKNQLLRLELFSDAVMAIVVTIMVLELKIPHEDHFFVLIELLPIFMSYLLSFIFLIIYWNNHHHLLRVAKGVTPATMWANAHLLFWLSLVPFVTGWLGETNGAPWPTITYAMVMLCAAVAYFILQRTIVSHHGKTSPLAEAIGADLKGKISLLLYLVAIVAAFVYPIISYVCFITVAVMWVIPDRRIARLFELHAHSV